MRIELEALQPQLQESAKQTAAMLVDIEIQSRQAGETREIVVAEEAIVNAKAIDANKLKVTFFGFFFNHYLPCYNRKNANMIFQQLCLLLKLLSML
jgi:hypothetical protein